MIDMKKFLKQTQITQCDNIKGRGLHLPTAPVRTKDEFLKAALRSPMSYIADWIYKFRKSPNLSSMAGSAQHIIHQVHSSTILQQISSIVVQIYTIFLTLLQGPNCVTAGSNGISRNRLFGMPACIGATSDKSRMGLVHYLEQPCTKSRLVKMYLLFCLPLYFLYFS